MAVLLIYGPAAQAGHRVHHTPAALAVVVNNAVQTGVVVVGGQQGNVAVCTSVARGANTLPADA